MKTLFETGRDYGAAQVLEIEAPDTKTSDCQLVEVYFNDVVRGIKATVEILDINASPAQIGRAVLAEYDAGRYKLI